MTIALRSSSAKDLYAPALPARVLPAQGFLDVLSLVERFMRTSAPEAGAVVDAPLEALNACPDPLGAAEMAGLVRDATKVRDAIHKAAQVGD